MMDRAQTKELKYLTVFLLTVVLTAALIWGGLEFLYRKPIKNIAPMAKPSHNLAPQQEEEVEKIPVVGENFETYQFKDPFTPLSKSSAPAENIAPTTSSSSTTPTTTSGTNTAAGKRIGLQVVKIGSVGNKAKATIRYNGKVIDLYENQKVGSYTVVDIDTASNTVDFLNGDEKFMVALTKG